MRKLLVLFILLSSCIQTEEGPPGTKQVEIVDPYNSMGRFNLDVKSFLARRKNVIRVAYYGDSNNSLDYEAGNLREYLGRTLGYGGHGFILAGQPLPWYQHREIKTKSRNGWRAYQATTPRTNRYPYGHGAGVGIGYSRGAYTSFEGTSYPNGEFSSIRIHYLCHRGTFAVKVDKVKIPVLDTCKKPTYKVLSLGVRLGRHKVRIITIKPNVVIFGVVFERERGVVVDGFGVGGASIYHFSRLNKEIFIRGLKERKYSLIILHLGTNLSPDISYHYKWMKIVVDRIREALGDVSILIVSPPPRGVRKYGSIYPHPAAKKISAEKRKIALKLKCAYWDYLEASGGPSSIKYWYNKHYFYGDLIHAKEPYQKHMEALLYNALVRNFLRWR